MARSIALRASTVLAVLSAGLGVSAVAGSVAPAGAVTRGFDVVNMTHEAVRFDGVLKGGSDLNSGPSPGTVVAPGGSFHFELLKFAFIRSDAETRFSQTNIGGSTYEAFMILRPPTGSPYVACKPFDGGKCSPERGQLGDFVLLGTPPPSR